MTERVYNLFLFCEGPIITRLGVTTHEVSGSDEEKQAFLQARVASDLANALSYPVPDRYEVVETSGSIRCGAVPYYGFLNLAFAGEHLDVFKEVFVALGSQTAPLTWITAVIDGKLANYITIILPPPAPPPTP